MNNFKRNKEIDVIIDQLLKEKKIYVSGINEKREELFSVVENWEELQVAKKVGELLIILDNTLMNFNKSKYNVSNEIWQIECSKEERGKIADILEDLRFRNADLTDKLNK